MKKIVAIALLIAGLGFAAGPDHHAPNIGAALPHNHTTLTLDGVFGNPALVGLNTLPRHGLSVLPVSVAVWSDKFETQFNDNTLLNSRGLRRAAELYLMSFFGSRNSSNWADEITDMLARELDGGLTLYGGFQFAPFAYATRGFGFNIRTYAGMDAHIPNGFSRPIFHDRYAPIPSAVFDISDLSASAIWASEIAVSLGYSISVPALQNALKLNHGAAGLGIKLILGHNYFKSEAESGSVLEYDSQNDRYTVNAAAEIVSIGAGVRDDYHFDNDYLMSNPVSGHGFGLDFGTAFHNKNHFLSFDLRDAGMILWGGKFVHRDRIVLDNTVILGTDDLTEEFRELLGLDTLVPTGKSHLTWLPLSFNAGYSYHYDLSAIEEVHFLAGYLSAGASLRQQIILGPGRGTYVPRLAVGGAIGMLAGYLPVRYSVIVGGPEKLASSIGLGIDLKHASLDVSYKAVGSPFLASVKGFEAAAAGTFRWGWGRERARKLVAEEEEAFQQQPPEPEPEDPPLPELPEEEEPAEAAVEEEPEETPPPVDIVLTIFPPEPEPEPQPTVEERQTLNTSQRAVNFRSGGADLTEGSFHALNKIAELLKQYPHIRYEIQGHTDSQGGVLNNLLLSAQRALTVKNYLVSKGAPEASLIAIGYGLHKPIADNNTVVGRALNRRVEFVQIETQEQYDELKRREFEMFKNMTGQVLQGGQ